MNQSGFSLLEMLLALLLSSILMMLVAMSFSNSIHAMEQEMKLIELQENARVAENILSSVIMQSGFMGCDDTYHASRFYIAHNHLFIHKLSSVIVPVDSLMESDHVLLGAEAPHFQSGDQLMLSDCHTTFYTGIRKLEITGHAQQVYLKTALPIGFQPYFIAQVEDIEFYLAASRINQETSLYEKNAKGQKHDLLPGITSWSIECFSQHAWRKSEEITDWNTVGALKIKLFFKTQAVTLFIPFLNKVG